MQYGQSDSDARRRDEEEAALEPREPVRPFSYYPSRGRGDRAQDVASEPTEPHRVKRLRRNLDDELQDQEMQETFADDDGEPVF